MKIEIFFLLFFLFAKTVSQSQELTEAWAITAGGSGVDEATAVALDHKGGIYVAGVFSSSSFKIANTTFINAGGTDVFIAKFDTTAGNAIWVKQLGGSGNESVDKMIISPDGSIYMADDYTGNISLGPYLFTGSGSYLAKLDPNGNLLWAKRHDGISPDITTDANGNVYLVFEFPSGTNANTALVKYDGQGNVSYSKVISSNTTYPGPEPFVAIDTALNVHVPYYYNPIFGYYRAIFNSAGTYIENRELADLTGREYLTSYDANNLNSFFTWSERYPLGPISSTLYFRGPGITASYTGCDKYTNHYSLNPVNGRRDQYGNHFAAGQINDDTCYSASGALISGQPGTHRITEATGLDIFITQVSENRGINHLSSTRNNGLTNEFPNRLAVDTINHSVYVAGSWSKLADSSRFHFGTMTLNNQSSANGTDVLVLKYNYKVDVLTVSAGDITICYGGSGQLNAFASGGSGSYSYNWSPSAGLSSTTINNPKVDALRSSTYVVTVTDSRGAIARDTVRVSVDSTSNTPTITSLTPLPVCEGSIMILESSAAASYIWSNGLTGRSITVHEIDTLTVTTISSEGCIGTSVPFITPFDPAPRLPGITSTSPSICNGATITLTASSSQSGIIFNWSIGTSFIGTGQVITVSSPGQYKVYSVGSNGCPSGTASLTIRPGAEPSGIISPSIANICAGDSIRITLATTNTRSVLWNNGDTSVAIWVKYAGMYYAMMTSSDGCTASTTAISVAVVPKPNPVISQNGNILSVTPAGVSYQWYESGVLIAGGTSSTLQITKGGNYSVTVTDINGCRGTSSKTAVMRIGNNTISYQVFPNPSNSDVNIVYDLPESSTVNITLNDMSGQRVIVLVDNQLQSAGEHTLVIGAAALRLQKGYYYINITAGTRRATQKILIL